MQEEVLETKGPGVWSMCSSQLAAQDLGGPQFFRLSDAEAAGMNCKAVLPCDSSSTCFSSTNQFQSCLLHGWSYSFQGKESR